ncbi:hypothetical protein [Enterobacter asburiae]|uniref:hypothetical protein n=1 Tax=Enterobacter asburiae TaxID=61645 RepID=UPI001935D9DB|nr:hypothetical protein [Enterobacter asburiae]QQE41651.1 hypothetical protein I6I13_24005 [Enterobacter asburiae]
MSTDNLLAELTSKTGLTETELNRQALIIGLMALCHPDAIAGDLVSAALTGSYSDILINYLPVVITHQTVC